MFNRNHFLLFLVSLSIILVSCVSASQIESDGPQNLPQPCSPLGIQSDVESLYASFQQSETAEGETAPISALRNLQVALNDLYEACSVSIEPEEESRYWDILEKLNEGGYVIYVRHTHTDRTRGDTDLSHCDTQRILSEQGRQQALDIRDAYNDLAFSIDRLITTEYCRTLETTVLAFGVPEIIPRVDLAEQLPDLLAERPAVGQNNVIVAHVGTLEGTVGLPDDFEEGDSLIYRPEPDGSFTFVDRIALSDWPLLAQIQRQSLSE